MSFKREGDDHLWLNVIKKRRISELFSYDIPEDEAHLMKNGRFACMVCFHRPVFDTIDMLAVHRNGKKHATCAEQFFGQKQELEDLKRKRTHEMFLKTGKYPVPSNSKPGSSQSGDHHKLLPSGPYDSRHRKKLKPNERKPVLDLEEGNVQAAGAHWATPSTSLPGNKAEASYQTIPEYKKMQNQSARQQFQLKPYIRKAGEGFPTNWIHSQCVGTVPLSSPAPDAVPNTCTHPQGASGLTSHIQTPSLPSTSSSTVTSKKSKKCIHKDQSSAQKPACSQDKISQAQKYLQARGSGWKKDLSGKWVRDEEAEFDSDEEPPNLP